MMMMKRRRKKKTMTTTMLHLAHQTTTTMLGKKKKKAKKVVGTSFADAFGNATKMPRGDCVHRRAEGDERKTAENQSDLGVRCPSKMLSHEKVAVNHRAVSKNRNEYTVMYLIYVRPYTFKRLKDKREMKKRDESESERQR